MKLGKTDNEALNNFIFTHYCWDIPQIGEIKNVYKIFVGALKGEKLCIMGTIK
jgi:hypothetical protein